MSTILGAYTIWQWGRLTAGTQGEVIAKGGQCGLRVKGLGNGV